MAKIYKVLITTELAVERLVKADSIEQVEEHMDEIVNKTDIYADDDPQIDTGVYERYDYDDDEADFDFTEDKKDA